MIMCPNATKFNLLYRKTCFDLSLVTLMFKIGLYNILRKKYTC